MAGKGDRPRNCFSQAFRDNWDFAFVKKAPPEAAKNQIPHIFPEKTVDRKPRKSKVVS